MSCLRTFWWDGNFFLFPCLIYSQNYASQPPALWTNPGFLHLHETHSGDRLPFPLSSGWATHSFSVYLWSRNNISCRLYFLKLYLKHTISVRLLIARSTFWSNLVFVCFNSLLCSSCCYNTHNCNSTIKMYIIKIHLCLCFFFFELVYSCGLVTHIIIANYISVFYFDLLWSSFLCV